MSKWFLVVGLGALNLLLAGGVYFRLAERPALAQIGVQRTDVAAVAGSTGGQTILYMLDVNTGALRAVKLDMTNRRIDLMATSDVAADLSRIR